jgi:hypothetical protein
MVKTAQELAEMFAKLPPGEKVWAYWYCKNEIEIHNSPDGKGVAEEEWNLIVEDIGDPPDDLYEYFSSAVSNHLSQYSCEGCYEYDYTTKDVDNESLCQNCGEENDLLA